MAMTGDEKHKFIEKLVGEDRLRELLSWNSIDEVYRFSLKLFRFYGSEDGLHILQVIPVDDIPDDYADEPQEERQVEQMNRFPISTAGEDGGA